MSQWQTKQLGEFITFHRGYDLPKKQMSGGPYPVVGSNGIIGWHNQSTTAAPGITIGRSGNIGKPFLCKTESWSHNTTLFIESYRNCEPLFIYYFLQSLQLNKHASGSAVPTLNRNHIHNLEVTLPDLDSQKKIGCILGLIDDKIELNNQINDYLVCQY